MADRGQDWSPPGVLRAMLWWPPVAFVIAIALPDAGLAPIAAAGLVLAVIGLGGAAVSRRRRSAPVETPSSLEAPDAVAAPVAMSRRRAA
ncbi:hypothetical protein PSU4_02250 [Pseudonocardia sulfidoxydans NBRC 16205]|uniref:Uncharacterized protein n=1 Tax=Pseudonocardia sulfidoxydans NBRC 16205 TaxID=1223511 RepID=A0A511D903_9PSEU|nr:hypothetical protein [Pseudonocardia sulfidoxydans]GEL21271.1 hypothetical protein PSU4_02250 [Pseudonocardia sulfidoxydans NBRC 16205]